MNNRRVLLLVEGGETPHSHGVPGYAGFVRYIAGGAAELQQRGYEVIFGTLRERGPLHQAMEELSCPAFALDSRSSRSYPRAVARLSRIIRKYSPSILHLNESIQATVGGLAGVVAGKGVRIFHRHHTTIPGPTLALSRAAGRLCHLTLAVSEAVASNARSEGVPEDRVLVALNGVPEPRRVERSEIEGLRNELQIGDEDRVVVVVGRLRPEKGHLVLVDAMKEVRARIQQRVRLVIVGGGTEEAAIRRAAMDLDDVPVHFLGHQPDVALWFSIGDISVIPSLKEPFGLVAAEAMACARPVVASNVDGLREIVEHRHSGLLVPPGRPEPLAEAIIELLQSRDLAATLASTARREYLERFTVAAMADRWIDSYEYALARFGRERR